MSQDGHPPDAWRRCYEKLGPKLLLFARQWLPTTADAEDAVQAGFVRFWRKQPAAHESHYPLLYSAVRSAALDLLRTNSRRQVREDHFFHDGGSECSAYFECELEQRETAAGIQAALNELPQEQRETLVLRLWGDLTFAEIATTVGESINTVAARYRYGLHALRKNLKPNEYERV
jgi:RNA polymerase sigma-70 factor (ECF subfamily)